MNSTKFVEKSWGSETWFANNEEYDYCGKILHINKNCFSSLHYHLLKHEVFYVIDGTLCVYTIDTETGDLKVNVVNKGQNMEIPQGIPHQLVPCNNQHVTFVEVSTFHRDADSYRIQTNLVTDNRKVVE